MVAGQTTVPKFGEKSTSREWHSRSAFQEQKSLEPETSRSTSMVILMKFWWLRVDQFESKNLLGTAVVWGTYNLVGFTSRNLTVSQSEDLSSSGGSARPEEESAWWNTPSMFSITKAALQKKPLSQSFIPAGKGHAPHCTLSGLSGSGEETSVKVKTKRRGSLKRLNYKIRRLPLPQPDHQRHSAGFSLLWLTVTQDTESFWGRAL